MQESNPAIRNSNDFRPLSSLEGGDRRERKHMEEYPDYRADTYNQEEIEYQRMLDEEMTREKRLEDADQADRSSQTEENE